MFRLFFDDNGSAHQDLTIQFGDQFWVADSYYLGLIDRDDPRSQADQVRDVLRRAITKWIDSLNDSESYWLLEMQDQATRWLQCSRQNRTATLTPGWASLEGHSVHPINDAVAENPPIGFEPLLDAAAMSFPVDDLKEMLENSVRMLNAQDVPDADPTPIFEHFRGVYGTQLLTAAISHFDLFGLLKSGVHNVDELSSALELARRPFDVLITALKAMGFIEQSGVTLTTTPLASEFLSGGRFDVSNYVSLAADNPGVLEMVERLRTNQPAGLKDDESGAAFIYKEGVRSAMDQSDMARHFTQSLAGRARNVAPVLAQNYRLPAVETLLDLGGGSGIYSIAYLARNPQMKAIILDRPEVLAVAEECGREFGVLDRMELRGGDMFADELPSADAILLSNILHDWGRNDCQRLVDRCASALQPGGELLIHDVVLDDDGTGPLPIAFYSAGLFTLTEGQAYSQADFLSWMSNAGLGYESDAETRVHCRVIVGKKS